MPAPRRVLVLSAPVGEGHVAAARVLATRMRARWPQARVREVESVGPVRDRLLRGAYALTMRSAPALYGLGYDLLVGHPGAASWFKTRSGARLARRLAPLVAAERPDLVVSTHPMVSGGLARLRRRGRLPGRTVAVVTDVAVHPFWVWPEIDETWTLLPASRDQALPVTPGACVRVASAAVAPAFRPGDRVAARAALDLPVEAFLVLLSGGSLAIGGLPDLVAAVRRAGADVLCGRDGRLLADLRGRAGVVAIGWSDRMPELLRGADLVLTTAGGMIASEALACGRPVLFAAPVPGHGRAGAAMTEAAGLGVVCPAPPDVTAEVLRLRTDPARLAGLAAAARGFAGDLDAELDALATRLP